MTNLPTDAIEECIRKSAPNVSGFIEDEATEQLDALVAEITRLKADNSEWYERKRWAL